MPIAIIAVVVVAALGAGLFYFTNNSTVSDTPTASVAVANRPVDEAGDAEITPSAEAVATNVTSDTDDTTAYSDGTYSATVSYLTPRRTEHTIEVSLTVENDIVVAANIVYDELEEGYSNDNQARFNQAYSTEVVGQTLDAISLSRVGSASLTSGAFNEAKVKIATEARG